MEYFRTHVEGTGTELLTYIVTVKQEVDTVKACIDTVLKESTNKIHANTQLIKQHKSETELAVTEKIYKLQKQLKGSVNPAIITHNRQK